eukprot:gene9424-10235_t
MKLLLFISLFLATIALPAPPRSKVLDSLHSGKWFKLICGASNQEVVTVRNLCLIYTVVGVDCIDVAADRAVVEAAFQGIQTAQRLFGVPKPYLMISINDGNDAHFRKASFNPVLCPSDCPRPCERICPALAIDATGVISERCYGCGRCLKACPLRLISEEMRTISPQTIKQLIANKHKSSHEIVDAIEIHTNQNHELLFHRLLQEIGDDVFDGLKLLSISFPDFGTNETLDYIQSLQKSITSHESWHRFKGVQVWQTDGNPMSGDILKIPSYRSFTLAESLLTSSRHRSIERKDSDVDFSHGKHFVQLSGGINDVSIQSAKQLPFSRLEGFGGFGLGGFARKLLLKDLLSVGDDGNGFIENHSELFEEVLKKAEKIVESVKA